MRLVRPLLLALLLVTALLTRSAPLGSSVPAPSTAASTIEIEQDHWFLMLMDGKRTGHAHESRSLVESDGRPLVRTRMQTRVGLKRFGTELNVASTVSFWETLDGRPERFESVSKLSQFALRTSGHRTDEGFEITTESMGNKSTQVIPFGSEVLFPLGVERAIRTVGYEPGNQVDLVTFAPDENRTTAMHIEVQQRELVELPNGEKRRLLRIETEHDILKNVIMTEWRDDDDEIVLSRLQLMGMNIDSLRVSRDEALGAELESVEMLISTLVDPGVQLPRARKIERIEFRMSLKPKARGSLELPRDSRQSYVALPGGNSIRLEVLAESWSDTASDPKPGPEYSSPSPVLQSDDPLIVTMTAAAIEGHETAAAQARALVEHVYRVITKKNLSVGLATASEVATTLSGDCTEHAVLAAALGRAAGFPSKLATGLVYFQGIFGYHMWTELYVDGAWRSLDPAFGLGASDATHIKLGESPMQHGFVDDGLLQLVTLISQVDLKVESYSLDGEVFKPGQIEDTPTGDRFVSDLFNVELTKPKGWKFVSGEAVSDPLAIVGLKGPSGGEATLHATSVSYAFSLSDWAASRLDSSPGGRKEKRSVNGQPAYGVADAAGDVTVAVQVGDTLYTLRYAPRDIEAPAKQLDELLRGLRFTAKS